MAIAILVGFFCGVVSGLGVGGGSILMVWLTAVLALPQRTAQGINLLYFLPTALGSLLIHIRRRSVGWQVAVPAAVAGAVTACIGAFLAQRMDVGLLRKLFGALLLIAGAAEIWKSLKKHDPPRDTAA